MNDTMTKVGIVISGTKIDMVYKSASDVGLRPLAFGRIRGQVFG